MEKKTYCRLMAGIAGCLLLAGCQKAGSGTDGTQGTQEQEQAQQTEGETLITGKGSEVTIEGTGASQKENVVTISKAGIYRLTGSIDGGRIVIDGGKDDEIRLIMDGFSITSQDYAAIYGSQYGLLTIELEEGTENTVKDEREYSEEAAASEDPDAAIFCEDDVVFTGEGTLNVNGNFQEGIRGKDDLTVESGVYTIWALNDGLKGKDSVLIEGGSLSITAGGDGIQSDNEKDTEKGYVEINGGTISITSDGKGIKSQTLTTINDGEITILSEDDAIHSNGDVKVAGGSLNLSTGDDAIHADNLAEVSGGEVTIEKSYEGIEGLCVELTGGIINLTAQDDGINAAGGVDSSGNTSPWGDSPFAVTEGAYIRISGGEISVNAAGDGLDSNGDFMMEGGSLYIQGPTDNGNGILDYNGTGTISGGTFLGIGSAGMLQTFSEESTQPVIVNYYSEKQSAGTEVKVTDSQGSVLKEVTPEKEFAVLIFSSPELTEGQDYHILTGETDTELTISGILNQVGEQQTTDRMMPGRGNRGDGSGRSSDERPSGERPSGELPSGERPSGERPSGELPSGEKPSGERPSGELPSGEKPSGERPSGELPSGELPSGEAPSDGAFPGMAGQMPEDQGEAN